MCPFERAIEGFIARCGRYCARAPMSTAGLSRLLFGKAGRLAALADGDRDVLVSTLSAAAARLNELERAPGAAAAGARERAGCGGE